MVMVRVGGECECDGDGEVLEVMMMIMKRMMMVVVIVMVIVMVMIPVRVMLTATASNDNDYAAFFSFSFWHSPPHAAAAGSPLAGVLHLAWCSVSAHPFSPMISQTDHSTVVSALPGQGLHPTFQSPDNG